MEQYRRLPVMVLVVAVALLPSVTSGQGLTGTLMGTVHDSSGGVIPGATVRVTSPALIGGERQTTSSDRGQWRLPAVPPGTYTLTVELAPKFAVYREPALEVGAGETVTRDATLTPAGITSRSLSVRAPISIHARAASKPGSVLTSSAPFRPGATACSV